MEKVRTFDLLWQKPCVHSIPEQDFLLTHASPNRHLPGVLPWYEGVQLLFLEGSQAPGTNKWVWTESQETSPSAGGLRALAFSLISLLSIVYTLAEFLQQCWVQTHDHVEQWSSRGLGMQPVETGWGASSRPTWVGRAIVVCLQNLFQTVACLLLRVGKGLLPIILTQDTDCTCLLMANSSLRMMPIRQLRALLKPFILVITTDSIVLLHPDVPQFQV